MKKIGWGAFEIPRFLKRREFEMFVLVERTPVSHLLFVFLSVASMERPHTTAGASQELGMQGDAASPLLSPISQSDGSGHSSLCRVGDYRGALVRAGARPVQGPSARPCTQQR